MARKWRETGSLDTKVTEEIENNPFITAVESRNLTNFPPLSTPLVVTKRRPYAKATIGNIF
jgi:hypothetical protein